MSKLLAAIAIVALAALPMEGCGSEQDDANLQTIREGRDLMDHPAPGDPEWETRRSIFMKNAIAAVGPSPSSSSSSSSSATPSPVLPPASPTPAPPPSP